jgi:hypothetical protein
MAFQWEMYSILPNTVGWFPSICNMATPPQEMESLGILVAERLINIELVDKTIGSLVSIAWNKYKVMIEDSRKRRSDPFLCEYFQWLAERIDESVCIVNLSRQQT